MKTPGFALRTFIRLLVLIILSWSAGVSGQTVTNIPLPSLPQNTRLMIWGDSVTEIPAWYPRYIEAYLLACAGRHDIKVFTAGHSGATLGETLSRQSDLQAFNPTIVQFFYGFNDVSFGETPSQWDTTMQSVFALYKSKGITAIVAGPGWTDGNNGNPATLTTQEQSLQAFNAIAHTDAVNAGEYESDICDSMELSLDAAVAVYGTSYTIAEHYTPNGAILVAYQDLKTLACNGNIGTVNVDMGAGTATASTGHTVVSYSNGTVILDSTIYPFCYNYDPSSYGGATGIASMLPYVSFSQDLNRFVLTVANLGAPSANVTWGSQTQNFTSAQLAAGVNLPAQFTATPFDTTFAQVVAAIVNKQFFEDYESKGTSNYFGNDNGGNVDNNMIAYQAQLDAGVKALIVPVRHTISIVPQGASTAVAPVITGTMMAYPTVGQSFSYQISALNTPTSYAATGLPGNGLSLNPTTGVISGTPATAGVTVVTLTASNSHGTSLPTTLTLNVGAPVPAAPAITSSLAATATVGVPFSYQITATGNPTNYFVVVPGSTGTEPPNSSLPPGLTYNTTTGVFSGTPTTAGTYNVELAAVNAGGVGATSETTPFVLTINPSGGAPPPAPTGLTATAGSGQVSLSWGVSAGATSYNVYRGPSAGNESTTPIATGVTSTSYTDSSLTNGSTYYYKVAAVNSSGTGGYSNEASAKPVIGLPAAPTGLTASAGNALVSLSWTASSGATSYNVYRGTLPNQENTTPIATGITTTTYRDTTVNNGPTYYYKVAAVNNAGTSGYSGEVSATPTSGGGATIYYQDSFSRSGDMTGSAPDVTNISGANWGNAAGSGQYPIANGTASINPAAHAWSAEYLPVNGTSGITLDGTKDFTLSVVVTSGPTGLTGICLSTGAPGNLFDQDFAALATCSGFAGAYAFNGGLINYNFGAGIVGPTTISLTYSASAGTVTYLVDGTTIATQTGVTAAQVAAIRYVGLGDDGYGGGAAAPAPAFDNFTFTVGSAGGGAPPTFTNYLPATTTIMIGTAFSFTYLVNASTPPATFSLASGSLPQGLTLGSAGVLSGSASQPGVYTGTIYASSVNGGSTQSFTITITGPGVDTPTMPVSALMFLAVLLIFTATKPLSGSLREFPRLSPQAR